jgi:hypothetical protein
MLWTSAEGKSGKVVQVNRSSYPYSTRIKSTEKIKMSETRRQRGGEVYHVISACACRTAG